MSKMPVFPIEWLLSKNLFEERNFPPNEKEKVSFIII
jgi:hypothetical protein